MRGPPLRLPAARLVPSSVIAYTLLALVALALVPLVVRRLGWGYGAFVIALLVIPLLGTKDFQGVGRYVLAAFPCFAVAGQLLTRRRLLRVGWLVVSGGLLLLLSSGYARGYYVG